MDLLRNLLVLRDRNRPASAACLRHPWITRRQRKDSAVVDTEAMREALAAARRKRAPFDREESSPT